MKTTHHGLPRRAFLKNSLLGLAGLGAASIHLDPKNPQPGTTDKEGFVTRKLGRTGLTLPVVSMGVMNADNDNLVRAALDYGIVHLDTAHGYQRGRNEEMIGRVIKGRNRDSFVIATKIWEDKSFLEILDRSLTRLGLDYVDILYLHGLDSRGAVLNDDNLSRLEKAKKSGKIRFTGVSTHGNEATVLRAAVEAKTYDVVLTAYNFQKDNLADLNKAIHEAAQAGIGIVAMKTQAGVFWDKSRKNPINMKAALKWALTNPDITTAIPGFTTYDQLAADLAVMKDLALTEEEKRDLRLESRNGGLYCRECRKCLPQCPKALPLPGLMRSYMYAYGYRNLEAAQGLIASLGVSENPCRDCNTCEVRCAKGFDIKDRVTDISRLGAVPEDLLA